MEKAKLLRKRNKPAEGATRQRQAGRSALLDMGRIEIRNIKVIG
jgi:hypothetical protein